MQTTQMAREGKEYCVSDNACVPEMVAACDVHLTEQSNKGAALGLLNDILTADFGDSSSVASHKCLN